VTFDSGRELRKLKRSGFERLIDVLATEEDRIPGAAAPDNSTTSASSGSSQGLVGAELSDLGVRDIHRMGRDGSREGRLYLLPPAVASFVDGELVNRVTEYESRRKNGSLQAIAGESHLFIWVKPWARFGAMDEKR